GAPGARARPRDRLAHSSTTPAGCAGRSSKSTYELRKLAERRRSVRQLGRTTERSLTTESLPPEAATRAKTEHDVVTSRAFFADDSERRAPFGRACSVRGDVAEKAEDDEDPLPARDALPAGVPEDHVEERGQRQEDEPEDRPDDRAKRAVDPGREDPRERKREPRREERDQYDEAAQRGLLPSGQREPTVWGFDLNVRCRRSRTYSLDAGLRRVTSCGDGTRLRSHRDARAGPRRTHRDLVRARRLRPERELGVRCASSGRWRR